RSSPRCRWRRSPRRCRRPGRGRSGCWWTRRRWSARDNRSPGSSRQHLPGRGDRSGRGVPVPHPGGRGPYTAVRRPRRPRPGGVAVRSLPDPQPSDTPGDQSVTPDRPSLRDYETARRKVLAAAGRPEEVREALREMRVARGMLPRSAGPVVNWIDELLPLPTPDQPGPVPPVSTDWVWQRIERRDQTVAGVSLVAAGVALVGLALWLTAALAGGLALRGALAVLGAGLLLVGLGSLYLARRLVSYGREHASQGLFRGWTGVELLLGIVATGAGIGGVLSFTGGDGHRAAVLWSSAGILAVAVGFLIAVGAGLVLEGRPPAQAG